MGSSGSGHLSDYSGRVKGAGGSGGQSGEDTCGKAVATYLEEVERSDYFRANGGPPPLLTPVVLVFNLRPAVVTKIGGLLIGFLPTRFNYLKGCLEDGFSYEGVVQKLGQTPLVQVYVDLLPVT